jgi:hypothetical protein
MLMRSLESRLVKVESELDIGKPAPARVTDPEFEKRITDFIRVANILLATMSDEHTQLVMNHFKVVDGKRSPMTRLTRNFIERVVRHLRGDPRPLALPPDVAAVYLHKPESGLLFDRECLSCGYDVLECDGCLPEVRFAACPLCGGEYESIEPGEGVRFTRMYRGWSKANPDKAVSVYIWPGWSIANEC